MAGNPKLIVLSEKLRGKSFELTKEVMSAGRNEQRDICIKDPTLSSHHCDFVKTEHSYLVRDNDSTNGTRVNNVPITEQELKNFDVIQLGGVEILFDFDDGTNTAVGSRTETGIDLDSTTNTGLATVKHFTNYSPFAERDTKRQLRNQKMVLVLVGVLGIAVLALLIALVVMAMNKMS
ncbi:FHA domain-containing protein [Victivallis sp. Marseille-Q1083]|uniref:FHA domain-containing protein n=1 Tax=Victivallis sp. Marseille-Q1083 TaxID=2717288 RepID=UPI0015885779|nr:FHA domain-containing protein [Victivallis sp. Marseille-Q1083]